MENSCADGYIFLPNAFSPNGDLLHDNFYLQGSGLTNVNSFAVYDRWGILLFESLNTLPNNEMNGWDGRSKNGERCNEEFIFIDMKSSVPMEIAFKVVET